MAQTLNLNSSGARVSWPTHGITKGKIHVVQLTGSWGSAVVTIEQSLDNVNWFGFTTPITLSAAGITSLIDLRGVDYVSAKVTTVSGSAATGSAEIGGFKHSIDIPDDTRSATAVY